MSDIQPGRSGRGMEGIAHLFLSGQRAQRVGPGDGAPQKVVGEVSTDNRGQSGAAMG